MATVEEKASPEAAEGAGERYKYVIEGPASDEYGGVQTERAAALDRMFEGKDGLPQGVLADAADEDFFMKGQEKQGKGEVKRLIPERYFGDEETKKAVSELLDALRGKKRSLEELVSEAQAAASDKRSKKLVALKLVGARLLQEHHPETHGKKWSEASEDEKRCVRVAEMMIHTAEMGALKRRIDNDDLNEDTARVFEKNYSHYAKNVDIPQEQREEYREVASLLREELDLTPKARAEVAEPEEVLGGEETVPLEQETEVGRAAGEETVVERRRPAVAAGEYPGRDEFERKVREHERASRERERAFGEETEGLNVFDMSEAQLLQRTTYIRGRMEERRGSDDARVRRGQEIVDEGLELPEGEIGVLEKTKTKKQVREQAEAWHEQLLGQVDNLISEGVEVASQSDPGLGKRLKKYEDVWLNELGLDRAEVKDNLLDKATTKWTETAYRRVKVGSGEEAMRAREEFTEVLRQIARYEKVKGEMKAVMESLADRFEYMNLRERLKDVERLKPLRKRGTKKKQGGV